VFQSSVNLGIYRHFPILLFGNANLIEVEDQFSWTTMHVLRETLDRFVGKTSWEVGAMLFLFDTSHSPQSTAVDSSNRGLPDIRAHLEMSLPCLSRGCVRSIQAVLAQSRV
jgi:hypothetical protein